jgi:hypothetical protein
MDRREFVKRSAGAAVGGVLLSGPGALLGAQTDAAKIRNYQ